MALVAPSTSPPSSQSLTRLAKRQDEACITTVWTTTWPAPEYDTCFLYQTLVRCEGAVPAVLCPRESQAPSSQPSQHQNQARDSNMDAGTLTGIFVAIVGLLIMGITMCCILKRNLMKVVVVVSQEGQGLREEEIESANPTMVQVVATTVAVVALRRGTREQVCSLAGLPSPIDHQAPKAGIKSGMEREQELSRTRYVKWSIRKRTNQVPQGLRAHRKPSIATVSNQECPTMLLQLEAATSPVHAAQASAKDAENTSHERAVEDDQKREAADTPEDADEEESNEDQVDGATHRQDKGGNEGPVEGGW